MSVICNNCGKELPDGTKFCGNCGSKITAPSAAPAAEAPAKRFCPSCGKELSATAKFCNGCGTKLDQAEAPAPVVQEVIPEQPVIENTAQQFRQPVYEQPPVQQYNPNPVPQQPQFNQNPYPQQGIPTAEETKGGSPVAAIILIILILAVIAVDVFVLFPDKIFGKDKDDDDEDSSSKTSSSKKDEDSDEDEDSDAEEEAAWRLKDGTLLIRQ